MGAKLLVSDDADPLKTVADRLGLDQQVCKAHVVRNTDALSESGSGRVVSVLPGEAGRTVERLGLSAPQYLSLSAQSKAVLLPPYHGAGVVQSWSPATGKVSKLVKLSTADRPFAAWEYSRLLVVVERQGIRWWDIVAIPSQPVTLSVDDQQPFIGSYLRVTVDLGTSGLAFGDLDFRLPDGEATGMLSYSRDDDSGPSEVMLLVGYRPGLHTLEAVDRATSSVVATLDHEITDQWSDANQSPAHWSVGELSNFTTGYTWGGGPSTAQNVDMIPQSGTRNICIVMVDVTDAL